MANLELALDEIINQDFKTKRGGVRRAGAAFGEGQRITRTRFPQRGFGGAGRGNFDTTGKDVVWINIANLPDTVLTGDLQELFQEFNLLGVGVHYDEFGQHMGTADLFVDERSAKAILREYANIAIDGQKIRFAIVNEQAASTPQFQNQQRREAFGGNNRRRGIGGGFGGGRRRNRNGGGGGAGRIRSNSGRSSRTYSRSRSPIGRTTGGGGGISKQRGVGGKNISTQVKSAAELDRELEAYMNGMKHPRIKLE